MPNWTTNEVTITAESKKDLKTFVKQINYNPTMENNIFVYICDNIN